MVRLYFACDQMKAYYVQPYKRLHIKVNFGELQFPLAVV